MSKARLLPLHDPFLLLLLMAGPFVGSFLGVLADRLPRGQSVVWGRSECRKCGQTLAILDLLPILSFAVRRGRCAHCGAPIPAWLLYMEIGASGAAVIAVIVAPSVVVAWVWALWLWILIALTATDMTRFRLPDLLTFVLLCTALILAILPVGIGLSAAIWGALAGAGSFAVIRWGYRVLRQRDGLGLGDVKLMAGLGAWAGLYDLPLLVLLAALGALAGGVMFAAFGNGQGTLATRSLPFGAALCVSAMVLWVIRHGGL